MNDVLDAAIVAYLAGDIDDAAFALLDRRLREDPAAARRLAQFCDHDLVLASVVRMRNARPSKGRVLKAQRPVQRRKSLWVSVAAAAMLALACLSWLLFKNNNVAKPGSVSAVAIATVEAVDGIVYVQKPKSEARTSLAPGARLQQGDSLHVSESAKTSFAYADGTKVWVEGATDLTLAQGENKRVGLERGVITAEVAAQPAASPMQITTPQAQAEIVGTKLRISTRGDTTDLGVTEGKVRLTRSTDHESLLVVAGFTSTIKSDSASPMTQRSLMSLMDDLPKNAQSLFHVVFADRPAQWGGEYTSPPKAPAGMIAIESHLFQPGTRFFGEIRSPIFEKGISTGPNTYLRFRYYTDGFKSGDLIKLMLKKIDGSIYHGFVRPKFSEWAVGTLRLDQKFIDLQNGARPLVPRDAIHNIVFLGAAPDGQQARQGPRLWIDEIVIFSSSDDISTLTVEQ